MSKLEAHQEVKTVAVGFTSFVGLPSATSKVWASTGKDQGGWRGALRQLARQMKGELLWGCI